MMGRPLSCPESVMEEVARHRGLYGFRSWRATLVHLNATSALLPSTDAMYRWARKHRDPNAVPTCPSGHTYDASNTYTGSKGERRCRACNREWTARLYAGTIVPVPQGLRARTRALIETELSEIEAHASDELRELIAEQRRDAKTFRVQHSPSLDSRSAIAADGSDVLARYGAIWFDRDDDRWLFEAAQARRG